MEKEEKEVPGLPLNFRVRTVDLETGDYTVVLNREDAANMGLRSQDRVKVSKKDRKMVAIVELTDTLVESGYVGILKRGKDFMGLEQEDEVRLIPAPKPTSVDIIKKRLNAQEISSEEIHTITEEITNHQLSDIELAAFVSSTYMHPLNDREIKDLTLSMVKTGETIDVDKEPIFDFHSIGGVPGNKVTLIVVPIVASAGLCIPKTCSRAISSAGGTADILETIANVTLPAWKIKEVAETVGGTIVWGGGVNIAPADDIIIRAEYPLSIDPYSQVLASVLAKKKAVGADHLLMDIPTGAHTKVESMDLARKYARDFMSIGESIDINVQCAITYGGQPVGRNIGPALEVMEALHVMEGNPPSSSTLEKSTSLAGIILEMGGVPGDGKKAAEKILRSGDALEKFREIVRAQGTDLKEISSSEIRVGKYSTEVIATQEGYVSSIHNKNIVKIARAAGAPHDKYSGVILDKKIGHQVENGDVLFEIYSDNRQRLKQAEMMAKKINPFYLEGMVLERIPTERVIHNT